MRKIFWLASFAMICCAISVSSTEAGFPWNKGCPNCQPEKKSFLQRLNDMPAFLVLCPGTEMSIVDYIRYKGCNKVNCEKCGDEKDWLCRQRYIRYCSEIHCPNCQDVAVEDLPAAPEEVPEAPATEEAPPSEDAPGKASVFPSYAPIEDGIR